MASDRQEGVGTEETHGDQDKGITREELPIAQYKKRIVGAIRKHAVIICTGETGSGKTTQLPQYLVDTGLAGGKCVAVTQPRRVAATSVAKRVAEERDVILGEEVGYTIRFDDCSSSKTSIKYMTDGSLIRECLSDPHLDHYGAIMLDEAHERSINTDILFGLVKGALKRRKDLKVIITSATLDVKRFSKYFNKCPILRVPGHSYPVQIYHSKLHQIITEHGPSSRSYIKAAVETVVKIHEGEDDGHILVFLTGQEEIENACELLRKEHELIEEHRPDKNLMVMPLYGALRSQQQSDVFKEVEPNVRKCVVATNIAETSLTVPGIRFVVDAGYVKQKTYNPERRLESLIIVPVSQVAAQQRAGRAGRTASGQCYRLYSTESYNKMLPETIPEIQRTNLANTVLYLKAVGIHDVLNFDYFEAPSRQQLEEALWLLFILGALDGDGRVTKLGTLMSKFPLDPCLSRSLIEAEKEGCLEEAIIISAVLSVESIWYSRGKKDTEARECHQALKDTRGDLITYAIIFCEYERNRYNDDWARSNFLNARALRTAKNVRIQLENECKKNRLEIRSGDHDADKIARAFCAGYFMNVAELCTNQSVYRSVPNPGSDVDVKLLHLHPSSSLITAKHPDYVIFQEIVMTSKLFIRHVTGVKKVWLQRYRRIMRMTNVYKLCGLPVPSAQKAGKTRKRVPISSLDDFHLESDFTAKPATKISSDTVKSAKERYLARKRSKQ